MSLIFIASCSDETTIYKDQLQDDVSIEENAAKLEASISFDEAGVLDILEEDELSGKSSKAIDMKMFTVPQKGEGVMPGRGITVSGFQSKGQALSWDFKMYEPGTYEVVVVCHAGRNQDWNVEGRVQANVAGQSVENRLIEQKRVTIPTTSPGVVDLYSVLGTVNINSAGAHTLTLEVTSDFTGTNPRFRSVMLVPVQK